MVVLLWEMKVFVYMLGYNLFDIVDRFRNWGMLEKERVF